MASGRGGAEVTGAFATCTGAGGVSTGGKYAYIDDQETPNTQLATLD
mgnify:CR=1 FL=1